MTTREYAKSHTLKETLDWSQINGTFAERIMPKKTMQIWEEENAQVEEETEQETPKTVTLHFYAQDGKAIAKYTGPKTATTIQVKSRNHAVGMAKKAVQNANEQETQVKILHGFENGNTGFDMLETVTRTCLSLDAYDAVMDELQNAKFNQMFRQNS